eukprot:scaffold281_cov318-Pavlova_lutheri.AAC.31
MARFSCLQLGPQLLSFLSRIEGNFERAGPWVPVGVPKHRELSGKFPSEPFAEHFEARLVVSSHAVLHVDLPPTFFCALSCAKRAT